MLVDPYTNLFPWCRVAIVHMHLSLKFDLTITVGYLLGKVLDNLSCLEEIVDSLVGIFLDQFDHPLT